ncbi:MAG: histidinol dehydrogenase, partial [Nitrosarchaeum sp.]|nr:histidinol dehydrogenase [Nitrosarchaeum sp.]
MKIIQVANVEKFVAQVLPKQPQKNKSIVESILKNIQKNGDSAIRNYEKKFSDAKITSLRLSQNEIKDAFSKVSKNQITAIRLSKSRLE